MSKVTHETLFIACGHSIITQLGTKVETQHWRIMKRSDSICPHCETFRGLLTERKT